MKHPHFETYEYGDAAAPVVLIQPVDGHDLAFIDSELANISSLAGDDFRLIAVKVNNWNDDLSPWEAPAVFGREGFGGGAKDTLAAISELTADRSKRYIIGGYSLAALFAIWAAYETDAFFAVAAASPSVWFPGFSDYVKNNTILADRVYLSLGDAEERTKNPVMSTVGDNIRDISEHLANTGTRTILEWNRGNHFKEPDIRCAKAFAWTLR